MQLNNVVDKQMGNIFAHYQCYVLVYVDYYWIKRRHLVDGIISNIYDYYLCKFYNDICKLYFYYLLSSF